MSLELRSNFSGTANFSRQTDCPICCEDFSRKTHRRALVHKDASGKEVHPIHANCLQDLLRSSLKNANTPPKCPLCREQITHVNGKPVQRSQRPPAAAPMDPLTIDAIDGMTEGFSYESEYRDMENQRLLLPRLLQSLIPGRIEHLQRRNLVPESNVSATAARFIKWDRDVAHICVCLFLTTLSTTLLFLSRNDNQATLIVGTTTAVLGYMAQRALRHLHQSLGTWGAFLFPTEDDQE